MPLTSMTGYADQKGEAAGIAWTWEARSVNARALDLRARMPEGFEALEVPLRAAFGQAFARGAVTVTLRLGAGAGAGLPRLNPAALDAALAAVAEAEAAAAARGLALAPPTAGDVLALRGVVEVEHDLPAANPEVRAALETGIGVLAAALRQARAAEGAALEAVLGGQLARIAELVAAARATAEARAARSGALLRERVAALLGATALADEARLAQELALIAVKADVTEELDRLEAHVAAARGLVAAEGPAGRKLDFLAQEFNREANTICSKAGSGELTALGLELKAVIDQLREQVQNVE
jgi:uncharacterized protein (TIGR00255 family)